MSHPALAISDDDAARLFADCATIADVVRVLSAHHNPNLVDEDDAQKAFFVWHDFEVTVRSRRHRQIHNTISCALVGDTTLPRASFPYTNALGNSAIVCGRVLATAAYARARKFIAH